MSTSPDNSAATRVASAWIGVKMTSSKVFGLRSQWSGLLNEERCALKVAAARNRNGPVPLGLETGGVLDALAPIDGGGLGGVVLLTPLPAHHVDDGQGVGEDQRERLDRFDVHRGKNR